MSALVINFSAARVARMLEQNAPPQSAADFIAHMALVARDQRDTRREAFWLEVASMVGRRVGGSSG